MIFKVCMLNKFVSIAKTNLTNQQTMIDTNHRLLLPETIWLEAEDYDRASNISNSIKSEAQSWQTYLNLLALFGLKTWLAENLPQQKLKSQIDVQQQTYYLKVGDFTVSAIAIENVLDEVVFVSQQQLHNQPTHFYVVLEINEEAEEAIFRGLLRRDLLDSYVQQSRGLSTANETYSLPLSWFDPEPSHLLSYCKHLAAEAISLPEKTKSSVNLQQAISTTKTKLSQWLQNTVSDAWLTIENLIDPQMNLAFSTRNVTQKYKRGKLIDLDVESKRVTMALLITITEEADDKIEVNVQLYPTNKEQYLPPQVQLILLSKADKNLQSVQARYKDNYIQLKPFKGKPGKSFSIEIALGKSKIREYFEL